MYKPFDEMNWNEQKHYYIKAAFEEKYLSWKGKGYPDDRSLYCVWYESILKAIDSLPGEPNLTVCCAMNTYLKERYFTPMSKIKQVFADR